MCLARSPRGGLLIARGELNMDDSADHQGRSGPARTPPQKPVRPVQPGAAHFTTSVPLICGWKVQIIPYSLGVSGAGKITVPPPGTSMSTPPPSLTVRV